ncbi:MAG: molybdopterin-dependent oxidoreductase [Gammaproteobacteria bacterium]|nr:molybdopterin-dependent oxidoreductase [Gammaproteobacteria bacterium]MBU1723284.1 molybdopterin-dependent oxidoreductase [Gammaproteobacteria bacterium]MBU2006579.1 molybdopterin-dependent oxidoreductase [Gammaproteobacteria bacterium]
MRHPAQPGSASRRGFLKSLAGAAALSATTLITDAHARINVPHDLEELKDYEEHWGFCDMCYWRCGLKVRSRAGKAFKIDGNPEHPLNRGVVCGKGNSGIQVAFAPNRLKQPQERVGARGENNWRPIPWDEALDKVAHELNKVKEKYGAQALVMIGHGTWEKPYHRLAHAFGTPNTTSPVFGLCCGPRGVSNMLVAGKNLTGNETIDLENCKYFLMMGRNITESLHNGETLGWIDGVANGAKVVYADPRYTITASKADEWLPIRPLTDHAFLLALINVVIKGGLYDRKFVEEYVTGLDELAAKVEKYTPEWQEEITTIPANTVRRIALEMAQKAPAVFVYSPRRLTRSSNDLGTGMSISILNSLFGVWDRKGGIFTPQTIKVPEIDLPEFPHAHVSREEAHGDFDFAHNPFAVNEEGKVQRADGAGVPGRWPLANPQYGLTNEMWRAMAGQDPYPLKALLTAGGNGFTNSTDYDTVRKALMNMDFYVATDVMPNEMNSYADILLPEASYLERYDDLQTGGAREGFIALREPAMQPLHDTKGSWDICKELSKRMGLETYFPHETVADMLDDRLKKAGYSLEELKKTGIIKLAADDKVNFPREFGGKSVFPTPSGKIELIPSQLTALGMEDAIEWEPQPTPNDGEFHFTFGRVGFHTHARTQDNIWLNYFMPENELWLHPIPAEKLGIANGDTVEVRDRKGRGGTIKAKVTHRIRPDTVFTVHGYGHWDMRMTTAAGKGLADSELASDTREKHIGSISMGTSMVTVKKV